MVLPPSMQSSLPAGWLTFTGRVLNPLDRYKRFQIIHPPFLDFAWRKGSFTVATPSSAFSFDHLVGASEQRRRHIHAKCPGSLEVNRKLILGRRLDRKIGRLLA